ncbi:DUF1700 domain-containing protein [Peptostreptococcus russellii]|uniref:DUF1700 domain-containing protein n=1 Tax=Peptostreptococcus russellii TaxID=215200 RepID=UPI002943A99B|nr:DUF1700 domain-containing protein [Peptostreptococcus russellii]
MNKKEFLKEIRFHLERAYLALNPVEIEDIMRDYDEYFREGLAEGKSEEDLVSSLGDPKKIVDEMVENDIEDKKYRKEDFDDYFQVNKKESNINIGESIKKGGKGINFISKKFGKILIIFGLGIADLIYFPAVIFTSIGFIVSTLAVFLLLPTLGGVFSVIGQSSISLIFPVIFAIGAIILELMLMALLLKLAYKANRKIIYKIFKK